eukprot:706373-Rhodomonas_salina.1
MLLSLTLSFAHRCRTIDALLKSSDTVHFVSGGIHLGKVGSFGPLRKSNIKRPSCGQDACVVRVSYSETRTCTYTDTDTDTTIQTQAQTYEGKREMSVAVEVHILDFLDMPA